MLHTQSSRSKVLARMSQVLSRVVPQHRSAKFGHVPLPFANLEFQISFYAQIGVIHPLLQAAKQECYPRFGTRHRHAY
jgi:hypothetical protein